MLDIYLLKPGQKIHIKSFDQCVNERYIVFIKGVLNEDRDIDEEVDWKFNNVKHDPGMGINMYDQFNGIYTFDEIQYDYYVHFKEIPEYVWPIEVLELSSNLSKLKIL